MMEDNQTASQFLYEDEFSYVTESGDIYQKENCFHPARKIGETRKGAMEAALTEYRSNFLQLEQQLDGLKELDEKKVSEWAEKLKAAKAIGDYSRLHRRLEKLAGRDDGVSVEDGMIEEEKPPAEEETDGSPASFYKNLMMQAREVAKSEDWKHGNAKLDELSHQWSDGPSADSEEEKEEIGDLYSKFTNAEENYRKHLKAHLAELDKEQQANLAKKKDLIQTVEQIVNNQNWTAVKRIRRLQSKWNETGPAPKEQNTELQTVYNSLIKEFRAHKVDRVVEKRQQLEDNLMMKMTVLDKMDRVVGDIDGKTSNWKEIDDNFYALTRQWRKIGRVPREKSDRAWSRYKGAQDAYYDKKYRYHKKHRSKVDSFTAKKENIIESAERLVEQEDMAKAARRVNKLHRRWKKTGNLPQRREDELWGRFKDATDAFNEKRAENPELIEQQEKEHYEQKLTLIEKAEELKNTEDWKKGHAQMRAMMKQWKKIGPVPRDQSNKIWKQFKGAMDIFYERRREYFKATKEQQKDNLKEKQQILEELGELGEHEDPEKAVEKAKKLQSKFKEIGYVPIKSKNETWEKYRAACDVIYDRMRAAKSGNKFDQELAKASLDSEQRSQIQELRKKHKKISKEVQELKKEALKLEESRINFNFSDDDNPLLKQMQENINKTQAKLDSKQNELEALSMEMNDIRSNS
jgi:hypothetical protein